MFEAGAEVSELDARLFPSRSLNGQRDGCPDVIIEVTEQEEDMILVCSQY